MLNVESSDSPQPTSKTPLDYPAANNSITENGENVNPSEKEQELKDYMKDKRNVVITGEQMKKKGFSQRGIGSSVPAHLNDSPFATIIPDSAEKSNSFEENSQENAENSADFGKNAKSAESPKKRSRRPKVRRKILPIAEKVSESRRILRRSLPNTKSL